MRRWYQFSKSEHTLKSTKGKQEERVLLKFKSLLSQGHVSNSRWLRRTTIPQSSHPKITRSRHDQRRGKATTKRFPSALYYCGRHPETGRKLRRHFPAKPICGGDREIVRLRTEAEGSRASIL
ncbi:hypothetical protein MRX96_028548 [Rhipicephalus microplus]